MKQEGEMEFSNEPDPTSLLGKLVAYERSRTPTEREFKKFENFEGRPPHLRPGPRHSLYPTLTLSQILSTRAVIAYLLAREYGFTVSDISKVLRCDETYIEKLLTVGDEIAPESKPVRRMKQAVESAARKIVAAAAPGEEQERITALLKPAKRKRKNKAPSPRKPVNPTEVGYTRSIIVRLLIKEFGFKRVNIQPLFGYLTSEQIRCLESKGERLLDRWSPNRFNDKLTLSAAKAIVAKTRGNNELSGESKITEGDASISVPCSGQQG